MPPEPITEEPLDHFFYRPLSRAVVAVLHPLGVSANQVTIAAAMLGICGGVCIGFGTRRATLAAAGALLAFLVLDCADGELARRRGGGSRLGHVLDGCSDYLVAITVHLALIALALRTPYLDGMWRWITVAVIFATGISKAVHSALFDAAKTRFRHGLGRKATGLESMETLHEELRQAGSARERAFLRIYITYVRMQRGVGAKGGEAGDGAARAAAPPEPPMSEREFLAWSVLGPTARMTAVLAALLASLVAPRALVLYPLFGLVFANAWLAGLKSLAARRGL
ncbi:MAG: CDP-alcohol phosphatidyltransferase family protein [Planctomycetes bacterium]|nr:CDP-alcohol phosphatidyltransferase family protein [Planctomycetota bacterium]